MTKTEGSLNRTRGTEFPPGWDEERVRAVIDYYDSHQDELLAMAEEELPEEGRICLMEVPARLVPVVQALIARLEEDEIPVKDSADTGPGIP